MYSLPSNIMHAYQFKTKIKFVELRSLILELPKPVMFLTYKLPTRSPPTPLSYATQDKQNKEKKKEPGKRGKLEVGHKSNSDQILCPSNYCLLSMLNFIKQFEWKRIIRAIPDHVQMVPWYRPPVLKGPQTVSYIGPF